MSKDVNVDVYTLSGRERERGGMSEERVQPWGSGQKDQVGGAGRGSWQACARAIGVEMKFSKGRLDVGVEMWSMGQGQGQGEGERGVE